MDLNDNLGRDNASQSNFFAPWTQQMTSKGRSRIDDDEGEERSARRHDLLSTELMSFNVKPPTTTLETLCAQRTISALVYSDFLHSTVECCDVIGIRA